MSLSSNPFLKDFEDKESLDCPDVRAGITMTRTGVVTKSLLLLLILCVVTVSTSEFLARWSHTHHTHNAYVALRWLFSLAFFGAIVLVILAVKNKPASRIIGPLFSVVEGVALGLVSGIVNAIYPGVVMQAIGMTIAMLASLLISFGVGWIALGSSFRTKMSVAVFGAVAYLACAIGSLGIRSIPLLAVGMRGTALSIGIVAIPGTVLIATCNSIFQRTKEARPKFMEWYLALGIVVSVVWVYYEFLLMLSRARRA